MNRIYRATYHLNLSVLGPPPRIFSLASGGRVLLPSLSDL